MEAALSAAEAKPAWQEVGGAGAVEDAWQRLRSGEDESHARALTLNLVCRAHDAADAERLAGWAWALGPRHPARVFLVHPTEAAGGKLRVAAEAGGSELLEIAAAPERAASIAAPLLVGDLPVVLLWHSERPRAGTGFEGWAGLASKVLVDAHRMKLSPAELAELAAELPAGCRLSDLTWTRLTPWRQLICQGLEAERGAFLRIAEVSITAGHGRRAAVAGSWNPGASLAGTLLAGWMAHQLEWQPQRRVAPLALDCTRPNGGAVKLQFEPCPPQEKHGLLRRLRVDADNGLEVSVEHHGRRLALAVRREGKMLGEWVSAAGEGIRSERDALSEEFAIHGHDVLFQHALERGLEILRQLEDPSA